MQNNGSILICSSLFESSTNEVMNWLVSKSQNVIRINNFDSPTEFNIFFSNQEIDLKFYGQNIISIWFRRYPKISEDEYAKIDNNLKKHLEAELNNFLWGLFGVSKFLKVIGSNNNYIDFLNVNKTVSLLKAREVGLNIPSTFLSNNLIEIQTKFKMNNSIVKPLSEPIFIYGKTSTYAMYTKPLKIKKNNKDVHIFPSQIQELIKKTVELRIFYLNGICYSAAIFSQKDKKTKSDFRNYNDEIPNKIVPYKIPEEINHKIGLFMSQMGLNTGSLDFILTPEGKYVFLEVNPVGQYEMISAPCNYYIDEIICNHLTY